MYSIIQPKIQAWVETDPEKNFPKVIKFVSLTILQPFYSMGNQIDSINDKGKLSPYVWGNKLKTFEWLADCPTHLNSIFRNLDSLTDAEAIATISQIPGIGLAKGGFVLQLVKNNRGGCLDRHNLSSIYTIKDILRDININKDNISKDNNNIFKDNISININTIIKSKPLEYSVLCNHIGSQTLWDNWCSFVDQKYPTHFGPNGSSSEYHLSCLERIH